MVTETVEQPIATETGLGLTEQPAGQPAADSTGGQEPTFEIDGEQVKMADIKTWKSGHMMQSDYTRKSQELASQREALKPYEEMAGYLKANPQQAQDIYNYLSGQSQSPGEAVDPIQSKMQGLERTQQMLVTQLSQMEANKLLNEVRSDPKYGKVFDNPKIEEMLIATHLQKGRASNLKETADELFAEINKLQASTKLETEEMVQKNLKSPTRKGVAAGSTMEVPKGFDPSKADWKDIEKRAVESI